MKNHPLIAAILFALLVLGQNLPAQTLTTPPHSSDEGFAVAPIPIVQPVTEEGAGLAVVYRYHLNSQPKTLPASFSAFGGFVTGNRSWGAGAAQRLYFKGDRLTALIAASYADVRYNFYGIGTAAGDANGEAGNSVFTEQKGFGVIGELLYRVHGLWYAGGRYRLIDTDSTFRTNPLFNLSAFVSPDETDVRTASLGPRVVRDSRDDVNYPREGSLLDFHIGLHGSGVGGQLHYERYNISYSKYFTLGPRQVLAARGAACFAGGDVPFFDYCILTTSENLRGYRSSRYRDRSMLASQAEYRLEAWKRVGLVGFGGLGEVAPKLGDFNTDNVLPGGGVGVRYRFTRESHVNIRFDYAWGKNGSHEMYFYIGEAF